MWPFSFLSSATHLAAAVISAWLTMQVMSMNCQSKLTAQSAAITAQWEAAAKTLREANDELQRGQTDIATRLAKYKRLHPSTCVTVSKGSNTPASGVGHVGADELLDYGAECEGYRKQRIVLEGLLK